MGLFDNIRYKDVLIPGCSVSEDESTSTRLVLKCDVQKALGDKTFQAREPVKVVIEGKDINFFTDGHLPAPTLEELKVHIRRFIM